MIFFFLLFLLFSWITTVLSGVGQSKCGWLFRHTELWVSWRTRLVETGSPAPETGCLFVHRSEVKYQRSACLTSSAFKSVSVSMFGSQVDWSRTACWSGIRSAWPPCPRQEKKKSEWDRPPASEVGWSHLKPDRRGRLEITWGSSSGQPIPPKRTRHRNIVHLDLICSDVIEIFLDFRARCSGRVAF